MPASTRYLAVRVLRAALGLAMLAACYDDSYSPTAPDPLPTPARVNVAFCTGLEPAWVAFQDGDGAWTRVQPTVAGARTDFHLDFSTDRGAVATARRFASGLTALSIQYGVPAELAIVGDTAADDCDFSAPKTMLGTVAGLDTNEVAFVSAGRFVRDAAHSEGGSDFTLGDLANGPQDVLATRTTRTGGTLALTGMILRRNVELADNGELPPLDFGSAEVFQPSEARVTLTGLAAEPTQLFVGFHTARSEHELELVPGAAGERVRSYHAVPAARLQAGDLQVLTASSQPVANVVRLASRYFRAPVDLALDFGAPPLAPQISVVAAAPTMRPRARFAPQADYERLTSINYQQGQHTVVTLSMTTAYAARFATGIDLTVPELTGVDGFDPQWALHAGDRIIWTSARIGGTLALGVAPVPHEGDTRRAGSDAGFIEP